MCGEGLKALIGLDGLNFLFQKFGFVRKTFLADTTFRSSIF